MKKTACVANALIPGIGFTVTWLTLISAALVSGCMGPPALHRAVMSYDETTARLEQELLLLNIARWDSELPVHFTVTSSIAATFDWRTTVGVGGAIEEEAGINALNLNLGASAAENPTFSIVPIAGQEFTRRILEPLDENTFELVVFQGARIDRLLRLLAEGLEVRRADGSLVRFIVNSPRRPEEYKEFRRIVMHLGWLSETRKAYVRSLVYRETLIDGAEQAPSAGEWGGALAQGLAWRQKPDGTFKLTKLTEGRAVITNYDPLALSDDERQDLNERIARNPRNLLYVDIRPGYPGGDFPIRGVFKLRSFLGVIDFIASGIKDAPEFAVEKDPRTGEVHMNPRATLAIEVTDTAPRTNVPSARYRGRYYSVADNPWDRQTFRILNALFQTTVSGVEGIGIPITISK